MEAASLIVQRIKELKEQHKAVVLAHNYQIAEVQDVADYTGDSLGLSIEASKTNADVIVFCGVHFMAETAAIISPEKKVLMPEPHAGCPMADMITPEGLAKLKDKNPQAKVVCYVNSSAAVKALSDICCTSANAVEVVKSLPDEEIIFVPDKFLGNYVSTQVLEKKFILWQGFCPTHAKILPQYVKQQKEAHPQALVLVHPECRPETIALADQVLSTGGMLNFVKKSAERQFIIGTELGIIHTLKQENPTKEFFPAYQQAICPNMKLTTLEKVLWSLEEQQVEVFVPAEIAQKAKTAIDKMLAVKL